MSDNIVTQLPTTLGVKDPETRQFLDALVNHLDLRGGNTDAENPQRYVTLGELQDSINSKASSIDGLFGSSGGAGIGGAGPGQGGTVEDLINRLEESIRRGFLYQFLQSPIQYIDMGPFKEIADAGIQTESFARSNKDNAIAGAVNTIWAAIGGDSALIQDGQLAQVSPVAASATKWNQLQATVSDLGNNSSAIASVRQDFEAYANATDGKLRAAYGVRVEVGRDGRRVAGGFGIVAEADGSGSNFIDFGVSADRFWISPPARSSDGGDAAQISNPAPNQFPFIALSTAQTVGGVTYQPGVYIRNANIANASIDTAKIKDLAVDTLKVAGEAISKVRHVNHYWAATIPTSGEILVLDLSYTVPTGVGTTKLIVQVSTPLYAQDGSNVAVGMRLYIDGVMVTDIGVTSDGNSHMIGTAGAMTVGEGYHYIAIKMYEIPPWNGSPKPLAGVMSVVTHGALR